MDCPRPRHAFKVGINAETGKPIYRVMPNNVNFIYKPVVPLSSPKDLFMLKNNNNCYTDRYLTEYIEVPCGECDICKANQARKKSERALAEASTWQFNEVVNLTYNDENLPYNTKSDGTKVPTLRYKDIQDFKKRLLKHFKKYFGQSGIRFMCACEYGEKYSRPHYHLILFNCLIPDKVFSGYTKKGSKEFASKVISNLWSKGFITVGEVSPETIQYVSNYCLKKFKGREASGYYEKLGIEPEKVTSSNRKGLGALFFEKHKDCYKTYSKIYVGSENGPIAINSNKYFDKLLSDEYGEEFLGKIKQDRQNSAHEREFTRSKLSGVSVAVQRANDERLFLERIKRSKTRDFKVPG